MNKSICTNTQDDFNQAVEDCEWIIASAEPEQCFFEESDVMLLLAYIHKLESKVENSNGLLNKVVDEYGELDSNDNLRPISEQFEPIISILKALPKPPEGKS